MPTKANIQDQQQGFFARLGSIIDNFIAWIAEKINKVKNGYRLLNSDYVSSIRDRKAFRFLPPSLILLVFFLVVCPFLITRLAENDALLWDGRVEVINSNSTMTPQSLSKGEVVQKINHDGWQKISSIGLLFGTYRRNNNADYEFLLKKNNEVVYSQTFSASVVKDSEYFYFNFDPIEFSQTDEYSFIIRAINVPENNDIALYYNDITGDAVFCASIKSELYVIAIITSIAFLIVFCIINILINSGKIHSEFRFLICALAYIIPLVFIYPAFTIPDEPYHFLSALRVSEYNFTETPASNLSRREHSLPANSDCLSVYFNDMDTPGLVAFNDIAECFNSAPDVGGIYVEAGGTTSRALAYLPAALGIKLGNLISDSPMIIFYFGRVFNLIVVSIIIIFALNLIKKHRIILLAIIFIPMFLQQAVSYSYDGILNALCILMVAYEIRFLTTDIKIRKKDVAIMALALAFIGLIKLPYVIIAAPLLAVKVEKFGKYKITKWLLLFALLIIATLPYLLNTRIEAIGIENAPPIIIDNTERGFPLSSFAQPGSVIKMFLRTLNVYGVFYIVSTIGYFGWFSFSLDRFFVIAYLVFLAIVMLSNHEAKLSKLARLCFGLIAIVLVGSFFLVMYLQWTPLTARVIEGVQGRYFLPAIPLLMLAFLPKKSKLNLPVDTSYAFFNLFILIYIIILIVGFY